ncbi:MAG: hypothetical protein SVX43_16080 [Cyanobacteriota bacterium]|nr:hypothetical protein [Cyanobacteriota bacterium]
MSRKPVTVLGPILLILIFIGLGDKFLPQPLSGASLKTRTAINNFMLGLFPKKEFENPNEQRERQIEDFAQ